MSLITFICFILCVSKIISFSEKYHWASFFPSLDNVTNSAQIEIYKHQNPDTCSDKLFLVSKSHNYGHGSSLHVAAAHLGVAIHFNRILLYDNNWIWGSDKTSCHRNKQNPDCYFIPLSKCQYKIDSKRALETAPTHLDTLQHSNEKYLAINEALSIPISLVPKLPNLKYNSDAYGYTQWIAQAMRYLVTRPLQKTMRECIKHLQNNFYMLPPQGKKNLVYLSMPEPPMNAIAMFVRHSDKAGESKLRNFTDYMSAAEDLVAKGLAVKHIILGTDNEHIIHELENNTVARRGFTFYYTQFDRENEMLGGSLSVSKRYGVYNYTISAISDLIIGTHPYITAFVVTTCSNMHRLIFELIISDGIHSRPAFIDLQPDVAFNSRYQPNKHVNYIKY